MSSIDNLLEQEFSSLCQSIKQQIQDKLNAAKLYLAEACEIADQYGVPFDSEISLVHNSYMPNSFLKSKFVQITYEQVCEISGYEFDYNSSENKFEYMSGGWKHSTYSAGAMC